MLDFAGKIVVITGGATGIGFALAKVFGGEGAKIVIGEPRVDRLDEAVATLENLNIEARSMVMDVADPESMEMFADFAFAGDCPVGLLINNAGIAIPMKPVAEMKLDVMRKLFDVNLFGVWHGCASFGRRMIEQGSDAAIYNVASENAFFTAVPNSAAYVASKHAVMGLTEAFREEMPKHIKVGAIFPGWVKSEMTGEFGKLAMDTDRFAAILLPQITAGEKFVVSHAFNIEHIDRRHAELSKAFAKYAPRYEGDVEYDVPTALQRMR